MKVVKGKSLGKIESFTLYKGCSFYFREDYCYETKGSSFEHCSFRSNVAFCSLEGCKFDNCGFSGELEVILCSQYLKELPTEIWQLPNLTFLNLSSNLLTKLPSKINLLSNVTSLSLSYNELTELPPEIGGLSSLTSLNLSYNKFIKLPPEIGKLSNLRELYLSGNKFENLKMIEKYLPNCKITNTNPRSNFSNDNPTTWIG
ncbi:leucine-rich repeat domain-containing protein [Candidatus Uabimicrobium sp. HlEnr_7]|uniref:leucine-rich repeat domain-containing protein n=1 Tax=Candidatus Uabimicrobium helgolandensis TaxID=3095367 RepID=UPI0035561DD0